MELLVYSVTAAVLVSSISFVGVVILYSSLGKFRNVVTILIAFAAGSLLGDVFLHLLPETIEENGYSVGLAIALLAGITLSLIAEAYIHCSHDSHSELESAPHEHHQHNPALARLNLWSDGLHNFLDGIAIGVSFLVSPVIGIASTVAIILHEIPQELADTAVLIHSKWPKRKVLIANFLVGLMAVGGVLLAFLLGELMENVGLWLVPFVAGQFIYIATADLLPEIHRKSSVKKYVLEISFFILGIGIMFALTLLE
jgi:zinc and cadmium transporter